MKLELAGPIRVAGVEAAFPFTVSVTFKGIPMHIHVIDVFKFNAEGKIASMRAYFGEENMVPA
jgi:steroid delta-isomerase